MNDDQPTCETCGDDVDEGQSLCEDCKERSYEEWRRHQDWLRMSDRERDDAIDCASH